MPLPFRLPSSPSQAPRRALNQCKGIPHDRPGGSPAARGVAAGERLLLIEDSTDNRDTMREILGLWGFQVETAGDGLAGVDKAEAGGFGAALVDIGLPGADGYEVARRLRAALGRHIFLIALTGYCQEEDHQRAFDAGFDAYMHKPADLDRLYQLLCRHAHAPALPSAG